MTKIVVSPAVKRLGITIAALSCSLGKCSKERGEELIKSSEEAVKRALNLRELRGHRIVRAYRNIMWRLGIDPTKIRPSGEALVRRVLRGRGVRPINPIVDACNAASMMTLVVISVLDSSKITPPLILRFARSGEVFRDFSGKERTLQGNEVVLTDSGNNILHLYPYRDSAAAAVSEETREVVAVAYGAPGLGFGPLLKALTTFKDSIAKLCASVSCSDIIVPE
jgi:DNA/RNA-binding domain of Phe-tRNA-synthetase-like protein